MDNTFFIIVIFIIIIIIGILANREISHNKEKMERRKREYARFRSVFEKDREKILTERESEKRDEKIKE
jgi:predicted Holliday junction resolvase-like endonuclease